MHKYICRCFVCRGDGKREMVLGRGEGAREGREC